MLRQKQEMFELRAHEEGCEGAIPAAQLAAVMRQVFIRS